MPKCQAEKADGTPCRAWAIHDSDPPRCNAHGSDRWGAPKGNQNAQTHGAYAEKTNLTDIIADLDRRRRQLAAYIDAHLHELEADDYTRLANLEGQLASRIGRLMRDKQQVHGDEMSELDQAIDAALDRISEEWNIEL